MSSFHKFAFLPTSAPAVYEERGTDGRFTTAAADAFRHSSALAAGREHFVAWRTLGAGVDAETLGAASVVFFDDEESGDRGYDWNFEANKTRKLWLFISAKDKVTMQVLLDLATREARRMFEVDPSKFGEHTNLYISVGVDGEAALMEMLAKRGFSYVQLPPNHEEDEEEMTSYQWGRGWCGWMALPLDHHSISTAEKPGLPDVQVAIHNELRSCIQHFFTERVDVNELIRLVQENDEEGLAAYKDKVVQDGMSPGHFADILG